MVYILLGKGFEEAEALVPADLLRRGGVEVALTGVGGKTVTGGHAITVVCDMAVEDVALRPGDMVVFPGGLGGIDSLEKSAPAMELARQAKQSGELWLCAICAAPTLLARAGIIGRGDRAVCYPGMEGDLTDAGAAACTEAPVVVDGTLITARGAGAAYDFGLALLAALKGEETAASVRSGVCYLG